MKNRTIQSAISFLCVVMLLASMAPSRSAQAQPGAVFTVNVSSDDSLAHDSSLGDGVCQDQGGRGCTLRAAIEESNTYAGADTIDFANSMYIYLDPAEGELNIFETLTINASSVWNTVDDYPGVTLNCTSGSNIDGLTIWDTASYSSVYGMFIINCSAGIVIIGDHNTIGHSGEHLRNVISSNSDYGIQISGSNAHHNQIVANWIGLSIDGDTAGPNNIGVFIHDGAADNYLGVNYISGNSNMGVWISGIGTDSNQLGGNVIGPPAFGSQEIGNGTQGILIDNGAMGTLVGEVGFLSPNIIADNGLEGVLVFANDTSIGNNFITNNDGNGVRIEDGSYNYVWFNTISGNALNGVAVYGANADSNLIGNNSIYNNTLQGIKLSYGNNNLPAPVITSAGAGGASGTACANCTIQLYSDNEDEGQTCHNNTSADASGNWLYIGALSGPNITAISFDAANNTSEFSAPYAIQSYTTYLPTLRK